MCSPDGCRQARVSIQVETTIRTEERILTIIAFPLKSSKCKQETSLLDYLAKWEKAQGCFVQFLETCKATSISSVEHLVASSPSLKQSIRIVMDPLQIVLCYCMDRINQLVPPKRLPTAHLAVDYPYPQSVLSSILQK